MKEKNNLNQILERVSWEKIQNSIAEVTGMAILTVDYRGVPVTSHNGCREFCKQVRNDEKWGRLCQKCDARGSLEGVISQKPYIYRCHFSIIDIAIPIIVEDNYLGAVMAGQVHLREEDEKMNPEQILAVPEEELTKKKQELYEYYKRIPAFTSVQLEQAVSLLYHLCDYFVKEAPSRKESGNLSWELRQEAKEPAGEQENEVPKVSNRIIAQAVDYIYSTKSQTYSLTEVANYCHVSAPYLSRLFTKEMGETYSSFVTRLKVTWAKEILQDTDMTVMEISDKLGFSEPGYFIKVFKKYMNDTPMNYRMKHNHTKQMSWYMERETITDKNVRDVS